MGRSAAPDAPALHANLAVLYAATAEVHTPRATPGSIPGAASAEFQLAGDDVAGTSVNHYAKCVLVVS